MTFHVEDVEQVFLAFDESKGVEIDGTANLGVLAADIHDEPVVDEHPHIVVAVELEVLALHVFELGLNLHGETKVMVSSIT